MKKIILLTIVSISLNSCTYQDVVDYLNGNQEANLTQQEKDDVNNATMNATSLPATETDIEIGQVPRPK